MPFTLKATSTRIENGELIVAGRIVAGAYFGPEAAVARSRDGRECAVQIVSHAMLELEAWPVLAGHRTVLILTIGPLPAGFELDVIEGIGAVERAAQRVDISHVLAAPEFWAMEADRRCASESVEEPIREGFGFPMERVQRWYQANIAQHQEADRWPYVRVPLPGASYIELEMAGGVEYQDRIWIGHLSGAHRTLLGYHSGHFSLPSLRLDEVTWLAETTGFAPSTLLWLSQTYIAAGVNPRPLERLFSQVPGLLSGRAAALSAALVENLSVENLRWTADPVHGWINNWEYSQRNPASPMSTLSRADFEYIRSFFP